MFLYNKPKLIAEIGCNHMGDIDLAKEMISIAKCLCKADFVKFQKRSNKELLTSQQYNDPHPNPSNSYGSTYGEHREFLEFNLEQNIELKNYANSIGIGWTTSTWDLTSAKEITSIDPELIKIPSACNNNFIMLEWLCDNFKGDIHISTGMTTNDEVEEIVNLFENKNRSQDLIIYACTSGYPVPYEDVCLLEIRNLIKRYGERVKDFGFSGHHLGISIDIAAYTLGASFIERHFTLDRTFKGTDHAASLEPEGVRRLVRDLNNTYKSLSYKDNEILGIEIAQREKLKYRK